MKRYQKVLIVLFLVAFCLQIDQSFHLHRKYRRAMRVSKQEGFLSKYRNSKYNIQAVLGRPMPYVEDKNFVIVLPSSKYAESNDLTMRSILSQTYSNFRVLYFDRHNSFGELQKLLQRYPEVSVEVIPLHENGDFLKTLYQQIHQCSNSEIVLSFSKYNTFLSNDSLKTINQSYQNPDVWMTFRATLTSAEYKMHDRSALSDKALLNRRFREKRTFEHCPFTFYAGLFKQIAMKDLYFLGKFIETCESYAYAIPMVEMAPKHVYCNMDAVFLQSSERYSFSEAYKNSKHFGQYADMKARFNDSFDQYEPVSSAFHPAKEQVAPDQSIDLVVYSNDSPTELSICLKSYEENLTGVRDIFVIYGATSSQYREGYQKCMGDFPKAVFIEKREEREKIANTILNHTAEMKSSPYIAFTSDNFILKSSTTVYPMSKECEKTGVAAILLSHVIPLEKGLEVFPNREVFPLKVVGAYQEARYPHFFGVGLKDPLLDAIKDEKVAFSELFSYYLFYMQHEDNLLMVDNRDLCKPLHMGYIRNPEVRKSLLSEYVSGKEADVVGFIEANESEFTAQFLH